MKISAMKEKLSRAKDILFLTKEEKEPCPKCKKQTMQFNPDGSTGFDFACIFTCAKCGENKQHMKCCTFYSESIRTARMPLIKYGVFQILNGKNTEYQRKNKISQVFGE